MLQKLYVFFKKETVLSIAVILALLSMFWVRPDKAYFTYIDFRTLGLLFCLMAIVAGLKAVGVFDILAQKLLMGTSGTVGVIRLLVLLCFFLSMVITNDVALITFVPLALIIVHKLPKELGNYWLLKIVAMQTIAANLGSMLTPIGNPQNLYLYARAGMSAAELITLMLPYSATALILLLIWIQVAAAKAPHVCGSEKIKTLLGFSDRKELKHGIPGRLPDLIYNLPAHCCTYHSIPDSSCIGSYIYAAKKQGKYKQGGLLPACHLYRIIYFYRQPWKDSAIQQFSGKNHGRKGNTYCCSCQSDYEQCSRCASFYPALQIIAGL